MIKNRFFVRIIYIIILIYIIMKSGCTDRDIYRTRTQTKTDSTHTHIQKIIYLVKRAHTGTQGRGCEMQIALEGNTVRGGQVRPVPKDVGRVVR